MSMATPSPHQTANPGAACRAPQQWPTTTGPYDRGVRRISVIGSSGSGKTTVARDLAIRLGIPHLELDAIHHLPGWTPLETNEFRGQVTDFTNGNAWVVDGNYSNVRDVVWQRADTVVWLDYPRWLVMRRLVPRTLRRLITRQELWNSNRESLSNLYSRDPEQNVILWSWTHHSLYRQRFAGDQQDPRWDHLAFVRLSSPRTTQRFVDSVGSAAG